MQLSIEVIEPWVGYSVVMFSVVLREAIGLFNVMLLDTGVVRGSVLVCSVATLDCMLLYSVLACASKVLGNDVVLDSVEANSMGSVLLSSMESMVSVPYCWDPLCCQVSDEGIVATYTVLQPHTGLTKRGKHLL